MKDLVRTFGTTRVLAIDPDTRLATGQDFMDLIGGTFGLDVAWIAIPVGSLPPTFFELRSGFAGAVLQKLVNYQLNVAIVGDISEAVSASKSLRDFVAESDRGRQVWFVADESELARRLGG